MTANQLLTDITWALYVVAFLSVAVRAALLPTRAHVNVALFFGVVAYIIAETAVVQVLNVAAPAWAATLPLVGVMALPYLLLRLVADFASVPRWVMRGTELGLAVSVVVLFALPQPYPAGVAVVLATYFVVVAVYDSARFVAQARRTSGVTRRRMQAIALGSGFLALAIAVDGASAVASAWRAVWETLAGLCGLGSGVAYFLGFAPPTWLRRAWQEPELRAFLGRAASLPRLPDTRSIVTELERGAAASVGAPSASIGLWDADAQTLRFYYQPSDGPEPTDTGAFKRRADAWELDPRTHPISGRAFLEQRALLVRDVQREDPQHANLYRAYQARSALSAPITAGPQKLGVLVVWAPRAPIFAQSDLELVHLLADQAAVILESRALIDEAARVQAREETARLKEDFLSSAAHDLKTPLTSIGGTAQLLLRRLQRQPEAPADRGALERLVLETRRLEEFVLELLDASRLEGSGLVDPARYETVNLGELAHQVCDPDRADRARCKVEAPEAVVGEFDAARVRQLVENLVENALKYSPRGEDVLVRVWQEAGVAGEGREQAHVAVLDHGIGIPAQDLPNVFERFHRGRNVDDRRFAGLGLGLYICKGIAEQHGGRIWAESTPGMGSTFHVVLPLSREPREQAGVDEAKAAA